MDAWIVHGFGMQGRHLEGSGSHGPYPVGCKLQILSGRHEEEHSVFMAFPVLDQSALPSVLRVQKRFQTAWQQIDKSHEIGLSIEKKRLPPKL